MPVLVFPTSDTVRLVLIRGLLPPAVVQAPARVEQADNGSVGLEIPELPERDTLALLARFGVRASVHPLLKAQPVASWAEIVPLQRHETETAPIVLYELPNRSLALLVQRLRRCWPRVLLGVKFLPEPYEGTAWVAVQPPPPPSFSHNPQFSAIRSYHEQIPGVWVAWNWQHPLATQLVVPEGSVLLCDPVHGVRHCPAPVPQAMHLELALHPQAAPIITPDTSKPPIAVDLRLSPCHTTPPPTLWILSPERMCEFERFCLDVDERLVRKLTCAILHHGNDRRILIQRRSANDHAAMLPLAAMGYYPDPRLPGLYLPTGQHLRPALRADSLARALAYTADHIHWLEPAAGTFTIHRVPHAAFQPLEKWLEHRVPPRSSLIPHREKYGGLDFERFALATETTIDLLPPPTASSLCPVEKVGESISARWMISALSRFLGWMRRMSTGYRILWHPSSTDGRSLPPVPQPSRQQVDEATNEPKESSTGRHLPTPDALLLGPDWAVRRQELESRILEDFAELPTERRARRWAELASLYSAIGQTADAAIGWMNAIWDCPTPPTEWFEHWITAECRAAGAERATSGDSALWDRWLSSPNRPGAGRVVAALAAGAGTPVVSSEWLKLLPRILGMLEQKFDDIPVRAAWLARWGLTRGCHGDTLGLARWYDRLMRRLQERGPALDLDAPSFLRFHGWASPERFKQACDRLKHLRKPIRDWLERPRGIAGLQAVGLAGETKATAEYAQLMLAWGLGVLGERTLSRDWAAWARKALGLVVAPRIDPAAHAFLGDLFLWRIQEANEGTLPKPGWPSEFQKRWEKMPEFTRYAINRLRQYSRILQPVGAVQPYAGRDLREFIGSDRLGERLTLFTAQTDPSLIVEEGRALLELATNEPTTATIPRVVYTLLASAAYFDSSMIEQLMDLVPAALEWVEAWLQAGRWTETERQQRTVALRGSLLAMACTVAPPSSLGDLLKYLNKAVLTSGMQPAMEAAAIPLFRAARRGEYATLAASLMESLDPRCGQWDNESGSSLAQRVGLAAGWFVAGDAEAGWRILDAARDRLRLAPPLPPREHTELLLQYAETLGFAPPSIALGRLEELFQFPDRLTVYSSTNGHFTLQALRLVDSTVRAIVTEDFTLSPTVRAWLDADEFLIRRRIHRDMATELHERELK